ncbi:MAG: type II toxin-antitoxin system HicA family toxin [Candidatus Yanofskybacteria bacterium]|nr:type II toxin-antitoxin system HicA family toxin [Candidatus Yanofskybacteria bacterium]
MSQRLPILKARDVIRVLNLLGFRKTRQSGSHAFFKHNDGRVTTVPIHAGKDIDRGLLKTILDDTNITAEEFSKYL